MFLTIIVVPMMYYVVDKIIDKVNNLRNRGKVIEKEPELIV
jgi:hypothetical protein